MCFDKWNAVPSGARKNSRKNSEFSFLFSKLQNMIYHAMIIMHINQDIKYANVSLFYVPKDGEKREKNFLSHQPNCIFWKVPFVFGMKGEEKKIKSRKFIPFFPSSHHDIYARAHTHDPRQYSWQKGIDQGPLSSDRHIILPLEHDRAKLYFAE